MTPTPACLCRIFSGSPRWVAQGAWTQHLAALALPPGALLCRCPRALVGQSNVERWSQPGSAGVSQAGIMHRCCLQLAAAPPGLWDSAAQAARKLSAHQGSAGAKKPLASPQGYQQLLSCVTALLQQLCLCYTEQNVRGAAALSSPVRRFSERGGGQLTAKIFCLMVLIY